ncbi:hypothetical protein ONZ45_g12768 [Pleurotus djamor]|nr:hypothetical protein ONZ45_g12768 [Pleurotus djamor]
MFYCIFLQHRLGLDGQLLPASQIDFIYDPDNPVPMPVAPEDDEVAMNDNQSSRPARMRRTTAKGQEALDSLRQDEYGRLESKFRTRACTQTTRSKPTKLTVSVVDGEEGAEDTDFIPRSDASLSEDEVGEITNAELAALLPTKIVLPGAKRRRENSKSSPPQIKRTRSGTLSKPMSQPELSDASSAPKGGKRNPIYLFYEEITAPINAPFPKGERRYVCYHDGTRKQMKVTPGMKYSTTGLVHHLRKFPLMFRLYEVLKNRSQPPNAQEIEIAANRSPMTLESLSMFVRGQEKQLADIRDLFDKQKSKDKAAFKQDVFDKLLTEWMVSCDQPFTEVDRPEFRSLIDYLYQTGNHKDDLRIPSHTTVRTKIMDNGEKSMEAMVEMFSVSLSLDAWTSSNQYAFLAIVAHFVSNEGVLEEILIDFQELIGSHTGANLAEVVWQTMLSFGLVGKVVAIVMDNASNNDTLMSTLEQLHRQSGYDFPAKSSRLRCIPHTIHLAALRLLEGIGALTPSDRTRAAGQEGQYQSIVTGDDDDDEMDMGDEDDDDEVPELVEAIDPNTLDLDKISLLVSRLRKIIHSVRSSPQRRGSWLEDVSNALRAKTLKTQSNNPLMLVLDSKTRWSSTHYMLRRVIHLKAVLNDFVAKNRDLRSYELSDSQWNAIEIVAKWLNYFHAASIQMSSTSAPMLSTTLAMFRGLQEHLREILATLPDNAPKVLRDSLVASHLKLSEYYTKIDESPFYTWASHPRISYKTLKDEYSSDKTLLEDLERAKTKLTNHFNSYYKGRKPKETPVSAKAALKSAAADSDNVDLLAGLRKRQTAVTSELETYFSLPLADMDVNPITWWTERRSQFPDLYQLAYDVLGIPGNAVAVERIFSAARDTISLRRASLKPKTIRTLMIYKQQIRRARRGH